MASSIKVSLTDCNYTTDNRKWQDWRPKRLYIVSEGCRSLSQFSVDTGFELAELVVDSWSKTPDSTLEFWCYLFSHLHWSRDQRRPSPKNENADFPLLGWLNLALWRKTYKFYKFPVKFHTVCRSYPNAVIMIYPLLAVHWYFNCNFQHNITMFCAAWEFLCYNCDFADASSLIQKIVFFLGAHWIGRESLKGLPLLSRLSGLRSIVSSRGGVRGRAPTDNELWAFHVLFMRINACFSAFWKLIGKLQKRE